jgi:hypothetical protein
MNADSFKTEIQNCDWLFDLFAIGYDFIATRLTPSPDLDAKYPDLPSVITQLANWPPRLTSTFTAAGGRRLLFRRQPNTRRCDSVCVSSSDARVKQYWDRNRVLSHAMGEHDRPSVVWDYIAVYKPEQIWTDVPLQPEFTGRPVVRFIEGTRRALNTIYSEQKK